MTQRKDFSSSRAATRVRQLSEDAVVFGRATSKDDARDSGASTEPPSTTDSKPNPKPKRELTHQVTVLLDDELFYRMKSYLVQPDAQWRSASVMLRELLEKELERNG
mgnify:CR=1 FL=1